MVWYDFVILAILVYTAWQGAQRGLVTQLAWIAAIILCFKFADKLAPAIEDQISVEQPLRHWIAMFILYLGFSLGSFLAARVLDSWLEKAKFKDFDRHLGGVLGLVKGIVIAMVITFFALTLSQSLKSVVLASYSGKAACYVLDTVEPITPEYFHEYLEKYHQELASVHDEHLGIPTSSWEAGVVPPEGDPGGGFSLTDTLGGLLGQRSDGSTQQPVNQTPTIDEMLRRLTPQVRGEYGTKITELWDMATPEQKMKLKSELESAAFESQLGGAVSKFLSGFSGNQPASGQGSQVSLLEQIGDVYKNREMIVQRSRDHFAGVPPKVQQAVLEDWYADLKMIQPDPDTGTNINTRLDERILRQLDQARISFGSLSFDLQQRLNQLR